MTEYGTEPQWVLQWLWRYWPPHGLAEAMPHGQVLRAQYTYSRRAATVCDDARVRHVGVALGRTAVPLVPMASKAAARRPSPGC